MKNKRQSSRHNIKQFLSVVDATGTEVIGNILDISTTGMRIISPLNSYPVGPEKKVIIEVLLNDGATENYTIAAQAIWIKLDDNPSYCQIGFRLPNLSKDTLKFLQSIIDNDDQ